MKAHCSSILRNFVLALTLSCLAQLTSVAQLPNAWQINDNSTQGGTALNYSTNLPPDLRTTAARDGFRYTATVRLLSDNSGSKTLALGYGLVDSRFLMWLDLNANGDLTVELEGQQTFTVTTNGTGAAAYHTHEIFYNGHVARYSVDGYTLTTVWPGSDNTLPDGQVFWGAGSSPGTGAMNVHQINFEVEGEGMVASYDAGTDESQAIAPDPTTLGWSTSLEATNADVSPDTVALPAAPIATTLEAIEVEPHRATLHGSANTGGSYGIAFFDWGTSTAYGNTSPTLVLSGDTNTIFQTLDLSDLEAGTTYHYRFRSFSMQLVSIGEDMEFTTPDQFVVTTLADSGDGSLRQAIADSVEGDTIAFDTFPADSSMTLTSGALGIPHNLDIVGPGAETLAISGDAKSRVFSIAVGTTVSISGITIQGGRPAARSPGSGAKGYDGGAIYNSGNLTLTNCYLYGNQAGRGGDGADGADGDLFNAATDGGNGGNGGNGGAIYNNTGDLNLINCTLDDNYAGRGGDGGDGGKGYGLGDDHPGGFGGASGDGGGIYNDSGSVALTNCTLYDNRATSRGSGGLSGDGETSSSDGGQGDGGGIYNAGTLTLSSSTITRNSSHQGSGFFNASDTVMLINSIVALNADQNISGPYTAVNCLTSGDPQLDNPGYHGGSVPTAPPLAGSPAIDGGDDSVDDLPATDQRGYPRVVGAHVDIGAVENITSLIVTTDADSGPGSLREAIEAVGDNGSVTFSQDIHGGTITLTSGQMVIAKDLIVDASALPAGITISGNNASRAFEVVNGATVAMSNLTIRDGNATGLGGTLVLPEYDGGGGILNSFSTLILTNCVLTENTAEYGGALGNGGGQLKLDNCLIFNNHAGRRGGGLYHTAGLVNTPKEQANALIVQSVFEQNEAESGGGIYQDGADLTIHDCSFLNNLSIFDGGALRSEVGGIGGSFKVDLEISSSVFHANTALSGGALVLGARQNTLVNCTVVENSATNYGGGISFQGDTCILTNSIVTGNTADSDPDIHGVISAVNSLTSGDPLLAPLGNYGGRTRTMPPMAGSPAIDAGDDSVLTSLTTDQRGYPRKSGAHVDIGAAEYQIPSVISPAPLLSPTRQSDGNVRFSFNNAPNLDFTVVASTNVALPLIQWLPIGLMSPGAPGEYQFVDPQATNYPTRFYQTLAP